MPVMNSMKIRGVRPSSLFEEPFCVFLTPTWKTFLTLSSGVWPSKPGFFLSDQMVVGKTNLLEAIDVFEPSFLSKSERMDSLGRKRTMPHVFRFSDGKGYDREILLSFRPKGEFACRWGKAFRLEIFPISSVALSSRIFVLSAKVRRKEGNG